MFIGGLVFAALAPISILRLCTGVRYIQAILEG